MQRNDKLDTNSRVYSIIKYIVKKNEQNKAWNLVLYFVHSKANSLFCHSKELHKLIPETLDIFWELREEDKSIWEMNKKYF